MSGVEVPREQKQEQQCASCMDTVVQSFSYFREQIRTLRREKAKLQKEIKALEEENAELKKKSASRKSR